MKKTKTLLQYSETIDEFKFYINFVIKSNGDFLSYSKSRYINKKITSINNKLYTAKNKDKINLYQSTYRNENKEKIKKCGKEYRDKNKEQISNKNRLYYTENKEYVLKRTNEYKENNKEQIKINNHLYYLKNKGHIKNKTSRWARKNKHKRSKYDARHREFGFDPINDWFENAHFHHTHENDNHDIGIFIPAELHRSIGHNNENQESMDRINKAAYEWFDNNK